LYKGFKKITPRSFPICLPINETAAILLASGQGLTAVNIPSQKAEDITIQVIFPPHFSTNKPE
jgi:hypothetical protein